MIWTTDDCCQYLEEVLEYIRDRYKNMNDFEADSIDQYIDDIIEVINR